MKYLVFIKLKLLEKVQIIILEIYYETKGSGA